MCWGSLNVSPSLLSSCRCPLPFPTKDRPQVELSFSFSSLPQSLPFLSGSALVLFTRSVSPLSWHSFEKLSFFLSSCLRFFFRSLKISKIRRRSSDPNEGCQGQRIDVNEINMPWKKNYVVLDEQFDTSCSLTSLSAVSGNFQSTFPFLLMRGGSTLLFNKNVSTMTVSSRRISTSQEGPSAVFSTDRGSETVWRSSIIRYCEKN